MESQGQAANVTRRSQPTVPIQQDFLFINASKAKTSRQGRRNARSFVMQKARRENPWSTSRQVAKQRTQGTASLQTAGTPGSISTASFGPTRSWSWNGYSPGLNQNHVGAFDRSICSHCKIFYCHCGQVLCPKCISLRPAREPSHGVLDPFGTSTIEITKDMSELLNHCMFTFLLYPRDTPQ